MEEGGFVHSTLHKNEWYDGKYGEIPAWCFLVSEGLKDVFGQKKRACCTSSKYEGSETVVSSAP